MNYVTIDIETFSDIDIKKSGAHKYVQSQAFEIILLSIKVLEGPSQVFDLTAEVFPQWVENLIYDSQWEKRAHNATFEIISFNAHFTRQGKPEIDHTQWRCSMAYGAQLSLPLQLGKMAEALRSSVRKDFRGAALIKIFCMPQKDGSRIMPQDRPKEWEEFKAYCIRDVDTEHSNDKILESLLVFSQFERAVWNLDFEINGRGIRVDIELIENAIQLAERYREQLFNRAVAITGLKNPNSRKQLITWLSKEIDEEIDSLTKNDVPKLLKRVSDSDVREVLLIRQELQKTSITKYLSIRAYMCQDHRVRGTIQYYGAQRTGRFAGRGPQVHNLPQNREKPVDIARRLCRNGDASTLRMLFGSLPNILSQLIRTAFIGGIDKKLTIWDYKAIEARILAWLAGEEWKLDVFRRGGDVYKENASRMFKVAIEDITDELRQRGKVSELALGFEGWVNALTVMDSAGAIPDAEKPGLISLWRDQNPKIVEFWGEILSHAVQSVNYPGYIVHFGKLAFLSTNNILYLRLPSGRFLTYLNPRPEVDYKGRINIVYEGVIKGGWGTNYTYGGKLTENAVQAISRDLLVDAMLKLKAAGFNIVLHVHDEIAAETGISDTEAANRMKMVMQNIPDWAEGLPVDLEGFETTFYKK